MTPTKADTVQTGRTCAMSARARRPVTSKSRMLALTACVSVALTGCAGFQPEPLSPALNATALDNRTLDDARLHRFLLANLPPAQEPAGAPRWNLNTLTLAALYYHPDLTVADAKLAGAQADILTVSVAGQAR